MRYLKLFELFDYDSSYNYNLVSVDNDLKDDEYKYDSWVYSFVSKNKDLYYIRVDLKVPYEDDFRSKNPNFTTLDFMDEESYISNKDNGLLDDIEYLNLNRGDAYRVITTVFKILKEHVTKNPTYVISFDSTLDRSKSYLYCIDKFFKDSHILLNLIGDDGKMGYYLYDKKYYYYLDDVIYIRNTNGDDIEVYDNSN